MQMMCLCILGNSSCFYCRRLTLFKIDLFKKFFQEHSRVPNNLDPDQDSVGPDLDPNCLQRLSADDKSRVNLLMYVLQDNGPKQGEQDAGSSTRNCVWSHVNMAASPVQQSRHQYGLPKSHRRIRAHGI